MPSTVVEGAGEARRFSYEAAFSRNIGWVTDAEQERLRHCRVAIAGMGGVGGGHLTTLARLGIGAFHIADLDYFDVPNLNRQVGAMQSTLGQPKAAVLARMAAEINPEIRLRVFDHGIGLDNLDQFLQGVDLYVDGLDFFAFEARRATFAACRRLGIPAVTVAPLGLGASMLAFLPGQMSFEDYFCLEGCDEAEMALRFLVGLSPALLQRSYLADASRVNLAQRRGPSTGAACQLCAGIAATEAVKLLLRRGDVLAAPWGYQFDAYRCKLRKTWRPFGNRNPVQKLLLWGARRQLGMA